jgi:hypothetical protein
LGHLTQPFEYVDTSISGLPLSNARITHLSFSSTASAAILAWPETYGTGSASASSMIG